MVPFDTPLPHKWTYYDIPASIQNAEITGLIEHNHRIFLPAGLPLTGFENLRPYLKRDDGGAVIIYPWRYDRHNFRGDLIVTPKALYADETIITGSFNSDILTNNFDIYHALRCAHVRNFPFDCKHLYNIEQPTYVFWLKIKDALIDGFSCWYPPRVTISGSYIAGVYDPDVRNTVYDKVKLGKPRKHFHKTKDHKLIECNKGHNCCS